MFLLIIRFSRLNLKSFTAIRSSHLLYLFQSLSPLKKSKLHGAPLGTQLSDAK